MAKTIRLQGAGVQLAADEDGDPAGPPVVLVHGGGQTRHAWGTTLATLAAQGWHGYSMDLRGHGDSEWAPDGDYSLDAFAADLVAVAATLPSPPALVGASLGGLASLAAIAETDHPVASALVLVDVAPRVEESGVARIKDFMTGNLEGFATLDEAADVIAAYNPHRPRPKDLRGLAKNLRQQPDGRWRWHWDPRFISGTSGSPDETRATVIEPTRLRRDAERLKVPTLLVRGRMSDLLSEQGAQELLQLVPHAQYADVAGAGHMVAGDRNDSFNEAVVRFLTEVRNS